MDGFYMPAEWEKHDAIWLSWPHDPISFPYKAEAEAVYADFIAAIHTTEFVHLHIPTADLQQHIEALLKERNVDLTRVEFRVANYADIWIRDYGPNFVVNRAIKALAMVKWKFNAWGGKYPILFKDNEIPYDMNKLLELPIQEAGIVMEGGSIDLNGAGTLMTTKQCLLNPNRNPELSQAQIEQKLSDHLGVKHFIWLNEGIEGDDTDGHIDDIARFVNPTTVVCAFTEDETDSDYKPLKENYDILLNSVDQDGNKLNVVKLPTPGKVMGDEGRLPASYANFYIGNGVVVVPVFEQPNDDKALEVLRGVFPDRKVVGINAYYLVYGFGTFHCSSQQQPSI